MWASLGLLALPLFTLSLTVLAIPSPAWQGSLALDFYGGLLQPVFILQDVVDSEGTCQNNAWEWMGALGGQVQTYAEEQVNKFATQFNISSEVDHYRALVQDVVSGVEQPQAVQQLNAGLTAAGLGNIYEDVERELMELFSELQAAFPAPDTALGHDGRKAKMSEIMTQARSTITRVGVEHGISEESLNQHLDGLCSRIESLIVYTGDLAEQHPELLEGLLLLGSLALMPEVLLLRPFLGLFGFGPYGPVKGSIAAWAQRIFFGAAVPKGSWFAHMQHAAMKFGPWWKWIIERVRGFLGIAGSLFAVCK